MKGHFGTSQSESKHNWFGMCCPYLLPSTAARSRDVTVIVTEGTLPPATHSTYNNRRHPTAALTPTLTTATPVASHTTVPEMMPLLPTGPADHYLVSEQKLFTHSEKFFFFFFLLGLLSKSVVSAD